MEDEKNCSNEIKLWCTSHTTAYQLRLAITSLGLRHIFPSRWSGKTSDMPGTLYEIPNPTFY